MSDFAFSTLLGTAIIPGILNYLQTPQAQQVKEVDCFYRSKLFEMLVNRESGIWHLSPTTLAEMYLQEKEQNEFDIPQVQA